MSRKNGPLTGLSKRRMAWISMFSILIYVSLTAKTAYIQVMSSEKYKENVEKQGNVKIELSSGRGIIYDRNNKPLTDTKSKKFIIVEKKLINKDDPKIFGYKQVTDNMDLFKDITGLDEASIYLKLQQSINSKFVEFDIKTINKSQKEELEELKIIVQNKTIRYSDDGLLSHLIGYIGRSNEQGNEEKIEGKQGIEKALNSTLENSNKDYVEVFMSGDAGKKAIHDLGILKGSVNATTKSAEDRHLKLTIDKDIQKNIEKVVDKIKNPSSAIISSVQTGEILGMVSRPNFNQNDISSYLTSTDGNLQNRTIKYEYAPGSVFKIIVAFAALESGLIKDDYTYECKGSIKIGDRTVKCHKIEGHGILDLNGAFANSCNTAFINIAKTVGKEEILNAAKTLHLAEKVEIGIDEESDGSSFDIAKIIKNTDTGNLAIGQGSLQFTPLQVNQMTQVIANNGIYNQLHIYDSIIDNNKSIVKIFESKKSEDIISPYTVSKIKNMMKLVVQNGTAKDLAELKGGAAVKTGTAQIGITKEDEEGNKIRTTTTHGWVTGFYPAQSPKYAITVFVENTDEGAKSAVSIFKDICKKIK